MDDVLTMILVEDGVLNWDMVQQLQVYSKRDGKKLEKKKVFKQKINTQREEKYLEKAEAGTKEKLLLYIRQCLICPKYNLFINKCFLKKILTIFISLTDVW